MYVCAHAGLSRDLLNSARDKPRRLVRVHYDGPYDGLVDDLPRIFEEIIFVAGGSGIAGCLPWIEHCTRSIGRYASMVRQVHILWVVKDSRHLSWASRELEECARLAGDSVRFHLYATDESLSRDTDVLREPESGQFPGQNKESDGSGRPEQKHKGSTAFAGTRELADVKIQRPYLPRLLPSLISGRRVAIFRCGPESMKTELHNTAAVAQKRVLGGEAKTVSVHGKFRLVINHCWLSSATRSS